MDNLIQKGYKQTEIGMIPEDWKLESLGSIINYTKGFAFRSKDYVEDGTRIIRVSDTTYDSIKSDSAVFINLNDTFRYKKWKLMVDDIIISTVGSKPPMYDSLVGKGILIDQRFDGALLNQNAVKIRAKENPESIQKIILHNLRIKRYIQWIESIYRGNANQASITLVDLFEYMIPLPTNVKEQTAIATTLSDVDSLITSLQKLIDKKKLIKQGAMQELLTGKRRLPGFNGDWINKPIKELGKVINGGTPSTFVDSFWNGDIAWATPTDITSTQGKYIFETERYITNAGLQNSSAQLLPKGTILLCSRATIGELKIANIPITTNQGFKSIICNNNCDNQFLYYKLLTIKNKLIEKAIGSTFLEISKNETENLILFIPDNIIEQIAISTILSDFDLEIENLEIKLSKLKSLKQGAMQQLLTGKTRLL